MKQTGFTLIELVMVLLVIAILAGVVTLYSKGTIRHSKEKTILVSVDQLQKAATQWCAMQSPTTYAGVSITALKTANFLPAGFTGANAFGGVFTVAADSTDTNRVVITVTAIPADAGTNLTAFFTQKTDGAIYDAGSQTLTLTF